MATMQLMVSSAKTMTLAKISLCLLSVRHFHLRFEMLVRLPGENEIWATRARLWPFKRYDMDRSQF